MHGFESPLGFAILHLAAEYAIIKEALILSIHAYFIEFHISTFSDSLAFFPAHALFLQIVFDEILCLEAGCCAAKTLQNIFPVYFHRFVFKSLQFLIL